MKRHTIDVRVANRSRLQHCSLREQIKSFLLPAESRFQQTQGMDGLGGVRSDSDGFLQELLSVILPLLNAVQVRKVDQGRHITRFKAECGLEFVFRVL